MSRYDSNPFDEEEEVNPFSDQAKGKGSRQSNYGGGGGGGGGGGAFYMPNSSVAPARLQQLIFHWIMQKYWEGVAATGGLVGGIQSSCRLRMILRGRGMLMNAAEQV